jgi:hypothetical protein
MPMTRCKVRFRDIVAPRFSGSGSLVHYIMEVDRCTREVRVWEKRHRDVALLDLGTLAKIVMQRHQAAQARSAPVRRVRRGFGAACGCGGR